MNERLAKLLLIALDDRGNDRERLAALNAASRLAEPAAIQDMLASAARRTATRDAQFTLGVEQQLEILQSQIIDRDRRLAAAQAEVSRLKNGHTREPDDAVDLQSVLALSGLSRATLYRRMAEGRFPLPCASRGTRKLWSRGELDQWLDQRDGRPDVS